MAITTGAVLYEYGTNTTVISDAANAAAAGTFSGSADATPMVQTDFTPFGDALLDITLDTVPAAGDAIHLYRRAMNINGTANDGTIPDANFKNTYIGTFPLDLVTTRQYVELTDIPLIVDQEFYIEYDLTAGGTQTNATVVQVRPKSYNAKV